MKLVSLKAKALIKGYFCQNSYTMNLFQELVENIREEYKSNSNDMEWRFLQTSINTLAHNNGILFITLNPGGKYGEKYQPVESCEEGCAYLAESWRGRAPGKSRLQVQIQLLFKEIANRVGVQDFRTIMENSICGHFIPFRSPSFDSLKEKDRTIEFSRILWQKVLSNLKFQLLLCIDNTTYKNITEILTKLLYLKVQEERYPIAWGDYRCSIANFEKDGQKITLVWLPHLSTFSIFGREKSKEAVKKIMDEALRNYNYELNKS
jgi:hypothetical protein